MTARRLTWRDTYKVHPAADVFPEMSDDELAKLGEDIEANGLHNSVVIWIDGDDNEFLLDGRNRLEAMERGGLKLDPDADVVYENSDDCNPVAYVISANIRRRHLTKQQQADLIVAAHRASRQVDEVPKQRHVKGKAGSEKDEFKAAIVADANKHGISKSTVERAMKPPPTPEQIAARIAADNKRSATLAATKKHKLAETRARQELEALQERNDIAELMGLLTPHFTRDEINRVFALCRSVSWRWGYEGFTYEGVQYRENDDDENRASTLPQDGRSEVVVGDPAHENDDFDLGDIPACLDRRRQP